MKFHKPTWDFLGKRKRAYQLKFPKLNREQDVVFQDIVQTCFLNRPTYVPGDPEATAFNEGRRSFGLRVMEHLELPVEELYRCYGGPILTEGKPNE